MLRPCHLYLKCATAPQKKVATNPASVRTVATGSIQSQRGLATVACSIKLVDHGVPEETQGPAPQAAEQARAASPRTLTSCSGRALWDVLLPPIVVKPAHQLCALQFKIEPFKYPVKMDPNFAGRPLASSYSVRDNLTVLPASHTAGGCREDLGGARVCHTRDLQPEPERPQL